MRDKLKGKLPRLGMPSLLGNDVWERARSTSFGLLGLAVAMGLAAVAFVLQLSWPTSPWQPLPEAPPRKEAVAAAVALDVRHAPVAPPPAPTRPRSGGGLAVSHGESPPESAAPPVEAGHGAAEVVAAPEPGSTHGPHGDGRGAPGGDQAQPPPGRPDEAPVADVPPKPVSTAPPPAEPPPPPPEPVAESSDVPGNGNAWGKGNGNGPPSPPPAVGNPHTDEVGSP